MWHIGIDLHRKTIVLATVNDAGDAMNPITIPCADTAAIINAVRALGPFRAVIEASGTYRWLYDLLRPYGTILLAHPFRLRAMIQRRTKTDKLDAQLLATLLRINQIPLAYIPAEPYQRLRDLVRCRTRLGRQLAEAKIQLRALLARQNREPPFAYPLVSAAWRGFRVKTSGRLKIWSATNCWRGCGISAGKSPSSTAVWSRRGRASRKRKPCWTSTASACSRRC